MASPSVILGGNPTRTPTNSLGSGALSNGGMMRDWQFAQRQPMSKHRDPIQGEFFTNEAMRSVADALIRESIQNSLDASAGGDVNIRFYVSGTTGALPTADADRYFESLWPHIEACDPDAHALLRHEPCPFVVIEDFGTTGLTGAPGQMYEDEDADGEPNHFYYFFRAEGKSGKSGADRGRWGVGKYVFPMTSQTNALFALTVRNTEEEGGKGPWLMGQSVLRNHPVEGQHYEPDGWYADVRDGEPWPIQDDAELDRFRRDWRVSRVDEPGLSVVIPFSPVSPEPLDATTLRNALVRDYFIAFLGGGLSATIDSPEIDEPLTIDAGSLPQILGELDEAHDEDGRRGFVDLASWGLHLADTDFVNLDRLDGAPAWIRDLLPRETGTRLHELLQRGQRVAVRVPVHVAPKRTDRDGEEEWSHFDVFLEPTQGERPVPVFAREGIIISDVRATPAAGIRALVLVRDEPLARMLGDAEGPAHTTWSAQTHKFSGRYRYGQNWLSFVKNSVSGLVRLIRGDDEDEDRSLAADVFWVPRPTPEPVPPRPRTGEDDPGGEPPAPIPPQPRPAAIRVDKVSGGFSVHLTGARAVPAIEVRVAYDIRGGDPFKRYSEFDFILSDLERVVSGATVVEEAANRLKLRIEDADAFECRMTGFDTSRDLLVRARATEVAG